MSSRKRRRLDRLRTAIDRSNDRQEPFAVDVSDRGDEYLVAAELPGLRTQDIDVSVWTDRLRIVAGYDEEEREVAEGTYLRRERGRGERGQGEVRRVIHLPEPVEETRVSASYNDGVLRVTLKKRDRPVSIEIE